MKFKAKTNLGMLVECIEALTGVVDNGVVNITKDGCDIRAIDPANVAMVSLNSPSSVFDEFEFEPQEGEDRLKIGIDFTKLLRMLKMWELGAVELELDGKAENLLIKSGIFSYSLGVVAPGTLRRVPKLPKLDYQVQTTTKAETFKKSIRAMMQVDGFEYVSLGVGDGEVYISIDEEREKLKAVLGPHDGEEKNIQSRHSLEYLLPFCKGMDHTENIVLFLRNKHPIKIDFAVANGEVVVSYLLAPRMSSEDV